MRINFKKYFSQNLYQQGGAALPYFIATVYEAAFKILGGNFFYNLGELDYGFFNKDVERKLANLILDKQEKDKKYIDLLISESKKVEEKILLLIKNSDTLTLGALSEVELVKITKRLITLNNEFWSIAAKIEAFDPEGVQLLIARVKKYLKRDISLEEIQVLCLPSGLTFFQEFRLSILEVAAKIVAGSDLASQDKTIEKIQEKYFWIKNSWAYVEHLPESFFIKEVKNVLNQPSKIRLEINEIKGNLRKAALKKESICHRHNFPEPLNNIFYLYVRLSEWRDTRKRPVYTMLDFTYRVLQEFAKRTKVPIELLYFVSVRELGNNLKKMIPELKRRKKACFMLYEKGREFWYSGGRALNIINDLNKQFLKHTHILGGTPASPGRVRGTIKNINTRIDFQKIKKGDIIVSVMTRPDFIPILHLAAAIITDEGGLACHAAIVAREFKIPCIVGTQTATKLLKDGDKVEVDANKGVINIISK